MAYLMSLIYHFWQLIVIMQRATVGFYLDEMPTRVTRYI